MTQIIAYLDNNQICLFADRRGSLFQNGKYEPKSDRLCKIVSVCGVAAIAYTGLAEVCGEAMDEWIAKTLAKNYCNGHGKAALVLAEEATNLFTRFPLEYRHHAFVVVGWCKSLRDDSLLPEIMLVSNALDENGNWSNVREKFTVTSMKMPKDYDYVCLAFGVPFTEKQIRKIEEKISSLFGRKNFSQNVCLYLSHVLHSTFYRHPSYTVGPTSLAVHIPRGVIGSNKMTMVFSGAAHEERTTFSSFEPKLNQFFQEGPTYVCKDMAFTSVRALESRDGSSHSLSLKLLSLPERDNAEQQ